MTALMDRIAEDEQEYFHLCNYYHERPHFKHSGGVDIYGEHAQGLRERYRKEQAGQRYDGDDHHKEV